MIETNVCNGGHRGELFELLWSLRDGTLTASQAGRLEEMVINDKPSRAAYVLCTELFANLQWSTGGGSNAAAKAVAGQSLPFDAMLTNESTPTEATAQASALSLAQTAAADESPLAHRRAKKASAVILTRRPGLTSIAAAVAAVLIMLATMAQVWLPAHSPTVDSDPGQPAPRSPVVAQLVGAVDCVWENEAGARRGSQLVAGQELRLREGIAEIKFQSGAVAALQGPAIFTLDHANGGRLTLGRLVAHVKPQAVGFTVHTPHASIIDLGTEFAVEVDDAEVAEVYVFSGEVRVRQRETVPNAARRGVVLSSGSAVRITPNWKTPMEIPHDDEPFRAARKYMASAESILHRKTADSPIWLGNLFDDSKGTPLADAMKTDTFCAAATPDSLGVERVIYGRNTRSSIQALTPHVQFDLTDLGWQPNSFTFIANDAYATVDIRNRQDYNGGIRTRGRRMGLQEPKHEEGIGAHANSCITFDLDEIRRAGSLAGKTLQFIADRAGINDSFHGDPNPSVFMMTMLADERQVRSVAVNGREVEFEKRGDVWRVVSELGEPIRADGNYVRFQIAIPADVKYLTLIAASAGDQMNYDHAVWSGARLQTIE